MTDGGGAGGGGGDRLLLVTTRSAHDASRPPVGGVARRAFVFSSLALIKRIYIALALIIVQPREA